MLLASGLASAQRKTPLGIRTGDFYCLFFQAEDGIRDLTVTGVQTCALPISLFNRISSLGGTARASRRSGAGNPAIGQGGVCPAWPLTIEHETAGSYEVLWPSPFGRSEERRVGKECRSRWSPYH